MDFVAIDVETANADLSSICQVGIAIFRDGAYADSWSSLVDPGEEFDSINVAIHGIDAQQVRGAPSWPHVAQTLRELVGASVVACHTPFDRAATSLACRKHGLADFDWRWIDTARVVRRAWPDQFATRAMVSQTSQRSSGSPSGTMTRLKMRVHRAKFFARPRYIPGSTRRLVGSRQSTHQFGPRGVNRSGREC
jgi:DNA polymerase III epsilon subunit-like protein